MSYTVYPYLVDLAQLRTLYGCRDSVLLAAVEEENAEQLREDEMGDLWGGPECVPTPTLRVALHEVIAGTVPPVDDVWQYWYAYELLCRRFGTPLPNDQ
jgi:hypothetical protein